MEAIEAGLASEAERPHKQNLPSKNNSAKEADS